MDEHQEIIERAILVGFNNDRSDIDIDYSMNELKELAYAAGAVVLDAVIQNKKTIDAAYYIGSGKVEEIRMLAEALGANVVIFNDELSGAQIRNIEAEVGVKIIDRTALILDIFAKRAKSNVSKLQVELAQLRYVMPRLTGLGARLSRTGGGIGTRGPGEQKLEIDRRRIRERVSDIQRELDEAVKTRSTQRILRIKREVPVVAIVGYTNSGKSTLMNKIIEVSDIDDEEKMVFVKDMLFATLDTFSRRIKLSDNKEFILVDTVGFVSKLPHSLVEAFKATLEEVVEADLLIHVVDSTNENYQNQIYITEKVLKEIGVSNKPSIYAFNKTDLLDEGTVLSAKDAQMLKISALNGTGILELMGKIKESVFSDFTRVKLLIPFEKGSIASDLMSRCTIFSSEYVENGNVLDLELDEKDLNRLKSYVMVDGHEGL